MDPTEGFLYNEFSDPGTQYECQHCGALFGEECVNWVEELQSQVAICPQCGQQMAIEED